MKRLHLICNAHLDPVWQWTWDEGIAAVFSTFKSAADLAEEFDYVFCHGESLLYETIEMHAPELFKRIKGLIEKGKWIITGGWYLQPDCLMPCGESFVRHIKVGQEYFQSKFGVKPEVATNYDPFGHSLGLVQILKKCGYKGYMICRPQPWQFQYPSRYFNWISPDGSNIIVTACSSYNSLLGHAKEKILQTLNSNQDETLNSPVDDIDYVLWGVGNHGGGPSRKDLSDIASLCVDNAEIFHSTPERLFADNINVKGEVKTSLVTCLPGAYSSMARIKQAHRETENLFYATEKLLAVAKLSGYNRNIFGMDNAEKKLLLSQFHDILPGTTVLEGEKEGLEILSTARNILKDYRTGAFLYLVIGEEKAKEGEYPVFVFNYMPYEITEPIEVEFMLADQNWSEEYFYLPEVYQNGKKVSSQSIKESSTFPLDWRKRIIFEGTLKPMGITRFDIKTKLVKQNREKAVSQVNLEEYIKKSFLSAPVELEIYEDTVDPWGMSQEELIAMGKNPKPFDLMSPAETAQFCGFDGELSPVHTIENGDVVTAIECAYKAEHTNALAEYRFYKNQSFIDLKITLEYTDKNKLIKLKVPVPKGVVLGDGPYLVENKPTGEISFQKWLGVQTENGDIFSIINDCLYAGSSTDGYLYFTLLRGAGYCFRPIPNRETYPKDRYLPRIENGKYVFNFRLCKGNISHISSQAELFNQKPYAVNIFPMGNKKINTKNANIQVFGKVHLTAMKYCKNGEILFRIYNPTVSKTDFRIVIGDKEFCEIANAHEIVSVIYKENNWKINHDEIL